jgi:urease accessory protein
MELRQEDFRLGRAMLKALAGLGVDTAAQYDGVVCHTTAFGIGCAFWGIPELWACHGYGFAWAEKQCMVSSRLVPLGQRATQRVLSSILGEIPSAIERAKSRCRMDGTGWPGLVIESVQHEQQYSRMFLS